MAGLAFISYRREDTGPLAQSLYLQLKGRFGSGQLFMDVNSVPIGNPWPPLAQDKLQKATVVLAVIGPAWLTPSDQYGRRRLDKAEDWVRSNLGLRWLSASRSSHCSSDMGSLLCPMRLFRMNCMGSFASLACGSVPTWRRGLTR
jgi:hypothetical protein